MNEMVLSNNQRLAFENRILELETKGNALKAIHELGDNMVGVNVAALDLCRSDMICLLLDEIGEMSRFYDSLVNGTPYEC